MPTDGVTLSPLETVILKHSPYHVGLFIQATNILRAAMATPEQEDTVVIAPLRGAMPMTWGMEGLAEFEPGTSNTYVEVPIGEATVVNGDGTVRTTASPRANQKLQIMEHELTRTLEAQGRTPSKTYFALLDEVQKGGTISKATEIAQKLTGRLGVKEQVRVFATQDSRKRVSSQAKTPAYRLLASNSLANVTTTVVPAPLIATDRVGLLDTIIVPDHPRKLINIVEGISVIRNNAAASLIRSLGSMSRLEELRHDEDFIRKLIDGQGVHTVKGANMVESWMAKLTDIQDRIASSESYIAPTDRS